MKNIDVLIDDISNLKPIPQIAQKVVSLLQDSESNVSDITNLIIYDSSITSNILKVCNSAYFGLPKKIESLQQAISYLGINQILNIVLMSCNSENLKGKQEGYDLNNGDLWKYSVASAIIAKELCKKVGVKNDNFIFTVSLIKDIGKVILSKYVKESYEEIQKIVIQEKMTFREAELSVIGIDHAELGGIIAEKWNFSSKMIQIIKNHHLTQPLKEDEIETAIVYMADIICMMLGIGGGADGLAYRFDKNVMNYLHISEMDLFDIMADFGERIQNIENLINMT